VLLPAIAYILPAIAYILPAIAYVPRVAHGMTLPVFAKYIYNLDLVSLYMNSAFK